MKARKCFVLTLILISSLELYPFEFSLGTTIGGLGIGFIREDKGIYIAPKYSMILDNMLSVYTMFEIHKYFALEGYLGLSTRFYDYPDYNTHILYAISSSVLARGQYEFDRIVLYGGMGMRFINFNFMSQYYVPDLLFALGFEARLGDANYLGLRTEYILDPFSAISSREVADGPNRSHSSSKRFDALTFSLTYRYAFGSKHKSN